tara:strand:+ start:1280 stop:1642 length:363 start_codon:yes stop_codon:yes gene_type:complete
MATNKLRLFINKFSLSWIACMLCMVRGDLSVLNFKHVVVASKTGTLTGFIVVLMSLVPFEFKYKFPAFMFIGCFIGDLIVHDTHYGYWWTEAFITASVATTLSFLVMHTKAGKKIEEFFK